MKHPVAQVALERRQVRGHGQILALFVVLVVLVDVTRVVWVGGKQVLALRTDEGGGRVDAADVPVKGLVGVEAVAIDAKDASATVAFSLSVSVVVRAAVGTAAAAATTGSVVTTFGGAG